MRHMLMIPLEVSERTRLCPMPALPSMLHAVSRRQHVLPEVPADRRRPSRKDAEDDMVAGAGPTLDTPHVVVLIAEDEESIAETLALVVEDAGYMPVVARNGREALALARQHRPQLIITDLMMPHMSGEELITAARADAAALGAEPPAVVVVTAASRARAEAAGADAVIVKPFDVMKLEAVMHQLLREPDARV